MPNPYHNAHNPTGIVLAKATLNALVALAEARLKAGYRINPDEFYQQLYAQYQTLVGPGHWFEQDKIYMRLASVIRPPMNWQLAYVTLSAA